MTATVRGRVGDTVTVQLGVRDHGPGRTLNSESSGSFEVVPPEETTVPDLAPEGAARLLRLFAGPVVAVPLEAVRDGEGH
ncbi:hypothetical protein [Streptomyces sp. NPDC002088]|uniref:hypothetical protein n=1 Tax=Streptomyces sp. NPDC002088 TaxID=3154665 RepID=UPI0033194958